MRPDTLSKLAVSVAICAATASSVAVGLANSRINDLEIQRDIYKSRAEDWEGTAGVITQYADDLADELKIRDRLDEKLLVEYAGVFECTAYCTEKYQHICGTGTGITASGQPIQADVTVAADQTLLPYGTVLYIEGVGIRIVQDKGTGVQGRRLDIAVAGTHEDALKWDGYGNHRVWVIEGSDGDE